MIKLKPSPHPAPLKCQSKLKKFNSDVPWGNS